MRNKILTLILVIFLLNPCILNAAINEPIKYYESISDLEKTVKISFHSWGEGLTTTIDLDDYFPIRNQNTQYLYVSPPEVIVNIDQASGIATLKASKDWIGTEEVYFSLVDIYKLYEGQTQLQNYVKEIQKGREAETIKTTILEYKETPIYSTLESLINKLEKEKSLTETPEIIATFEKPDLKIDVGEDINFNIGVQTRTKEGIKTYRPYLLLNLRPEKPIQALEEGKGYSIWILLPLFIILIVLAIMLYFYIRDNLPKIKRFINKFIPTKKKTIIDILNNDIKNLKTFSRELKNLSNQLNKLSLDKSSDQYFDIIKKFFNSVTHPGYEFTYTELKKEIIEEDIDENLKDKLINFSKEISDLRFSEERLTKPHINSLIKETQDFIDDAIASKQKAKIKEHKELVRKTPWINYLNYIKSFFKKEEKPKEYKKRLDFKKFLHDTFGLYKTEDEKRKEILKEEKRKIEKEKEKITKEKKELKSIKNFFHGLGLYKTEAEKLREQRIKQQLRIEKKKEKERIKKEKTKLIRKFLHDNFGLYKTEAEKLKELQKRKELKLEKKREKARKKEEKRRERIKLVKSFLHNLGLYKTEAEKLREQREKERLKLEKRRIELEKEKRKKKAIKRLFHSLGLYKTKEEKELELKKKREIGLEKIRKQKIKERTSLEKEREEEERKREKIRLIKRFLHDKFGFFKTISEKEKEAERIKKLRLEEKELELKKKREHEKTEKEIKKTIKKFLHDTFGLYKTEDEKRKEILKEEQLKLKKKREEERKLQKKKEIELEKLRELQRRKEIELEKERKKEEKKRARRKNIKKFLHDNFGLYKTEAEKEKIHIQRKIKEVEIKKRLRKNILSEIATFSRIIFKKRKLTPAEELVVLMRQERQAIALKNIKKAHEIDKKINKLYKEIQKKPSLISKELHQVYQNLKDELHLFHEKISERKLYLEPTFFGKLQKLYSPKIEKGKIDEIKLLVKKIEHQFELKTRDDKKISEYFLRANSLYNNLNNISKKFISPELLKIKNKIGFIAVKSSIEKAEDALKFNQLKKAEEIYNKLSRTYYELPTKDKEQLHEKRLLLQQKIKPIKKPLFKFPILHKPKKPLFKFPVLPKFKFIKKLFKPKIKEEIKKIKERLETKEKPLLKKEIEVREKIKNYLTTKKPHFPSLQTFLVKKETQNKYLNQTFKLIRDTNLYLAKKQHSKAKETYLAAIKMFKELPSDISPEIRDNIYHKLLPLKKQILDLSLHNSLQKTKEAITAGKIEDARTHHETASKIYTHLATKRDIFIPGPITLKEQELEKLIIKIQNLIKDNKIKEARQLYIKINQIYNEIPPVKKQLYYNKISIIYQDLIKI